MKKYQSDSANNKQLISACNSRNNDTAKYDYYATDPIAVEKLLAVENFNEWIWEPACGEGHISKVLEAAGYDVISTDLIYRGYGEKESFDFLKCTESDLMEDIITNPPYKFAEEFIEKALSVIRYGCKVAMLLKLTFLASQGRLKLFKKYPPKIIYVFSKRIECGKNGEFLEKKGVDYAWFIWEKGYNGETNLRWL